MRACEGCRRRKIKCDAATTNTWPCSACIRLKLHCVPPTVNYDRDFPSTNQDPGRAEYESGEGDEEYHQQLSIEQHLVDSQKQVPQTYPQQIQYAGNVDVYQPNSYDQPQSSQRNMSYSHLQTPINVLDSQYSSQNIFPIPPVQQQSQQPQQHQSPPQPETPESYQQDQYGQRDLADFLGELKMDATGTGTC